MLSASSFTPSDMMSLPIVCQQLSQLSKDTTEFTPFPSLLLAGSVHGADLVCPVSHFASDKGEPDIAVVPHQDCEIGPVAGQQGPSSDVQPQEVSRG